MSKFKDKLVQGVSLTFGLPIFIVGIIITPIPPPFPPGWPVALLGLWILSFGFDWAEKRRHQLLNKIKKLWNDALAPVKQEWHRQKEEQDKTTKK